MKAIGYVRVSTTEQSLEERFSLPHQREHIAQECKSRGWQLLNVYEDTESGKSTRKRTGFANAMEAMKTADVLVVHELDRLSRNLIDTLLIVDDLGKVGKKFVSIHDNIDSSSEGGELQLHILAVFAHYFRKQLGRKVYGSMATRAEQGLYNSKPPFGYKLVNKRLVIDLEEAWIVKKIFDMYLDNRGARAIAEELNSLGIRTRQNALWSDFPIKRMLRNRVYIGNTVWNQTQRMDTKERKRPEQDWIVAENTHEAIIDLATFNAVQERIAVKSKIGGRAQESPYLLSGLLRCAHCGSSMVGNKNNGRKRKSGETPVYFRYICSGYHKQGICHYVFTHCDEIEKKVLDEIKKFIGTPDQAKILKKKKTVNTTVLYQEQKQLKAELDSIKNKFKRQMEAYEAGVLTLDELKDAKHRVLEQEERIKKELSLLDDKLNSLDMTEINRIRMADFYEVFASRDTLKIKAWLQQHIKQITFTDIETFNITWNV